MYLLQKVIKNWMKRLFQSVLIVEVQIYLFLQNNDKHKILLIMESTQGQHMTIYSRI